MSVPERSVAKLRGGANNQVRSHSQKFENPPLFLIFASGNISKALNLRQLQENEQKRKSTRCHEWRSR